MSTSRAIPPRRPDQCAAPLFPRPSTNGLLCFSTCARLGQPPALRANAAVPSAVVEPHRVLFILQQHQCRDGSGERIAPALDGHFANDSLRPPAFERNVTASRAQGSHLAERHDG